MPTHKWLFVGAGLVDYRFLFSLQDGLSGRTLRAQAGFRKRETVDGHRSIRYCSFDTRSYRHALRSGFEGEGVAQGDSDAGGWWYPLNRPTLW